jgi:hypothetical protein
MSSSGIAPERAWNFRTGCGNQMADRPAPVPKRGMAEQNDVVPTRLKRPLHSEWAFSFRKWLQASKKCPTHERAQPQAGESQGVRGALGCLV